VSAAQRAVASVWPAPYREFKPGEIGNPWGDDIGDHVDAFLVFDAGMAGPEPDWPNVDPYEVGVVVERWSYQPAVTYTAHGQSTVRPAIPGEVYYLLLGRCEYVGQPGDIAPMLAEWMGSEGLLGVVAGSCVWVFSES